MHKGASGGTAAAQRLQKGFDNLTREELAVLAAQLEQASLTTLAAISGKRALRTGANALNWASRVLAGGLRKAGLETPQWMEGPLPELDAPTVEQDLAQRKERLGTWPIDVLRHQVITDLARRAGIKSTDPAEVLVRAAQVSAPAFGINPDLAPAVLVPALAEAFYRKLIEQTRRRYDRMSPDQKEEVHRRIDDSLEELSPEERQRIQEALKLERLSGRTLMTMLSAGGGVVLATSLVSSTGFSAYVALTTIMHAVMTTLLGITLPFSVYTSATTLLSFLLGPVGVALMLVTAGGFTGLRGQQHIDHYMLALVVTQALIAAGPVIEPAVDLEELARLKEMAEEYARLQEEARTKERQLADAEKTIQHFQARMAAVQEEKDKEVRDRDAKIAALTQQLEQLELDRAAAAEIDERRRFLEARLAEVTEEKERFLRDHEAQMAVLTQELDRIEREKAVIEEQLAQHQILIERNVQKQSQDMQRRFKIVYGDKFVVDDYVTRWLARLHDLDRRYKAERTMRTLSDGDYRHVRPDARVKDTRPAVYEAEFDKTGRLYFVWENSRLRFVRIGDKNSQNADLQWLRENFR